jgi:hypothetical protein
MKVLDVYEQTNPRAHGNPPYALRYAAGRPEGRYDTVAEAFEAAQPGAAIVTAEGWWIVAYVREPQDDYERAEAALDYTPRSLDEMLDVLSGKKQEPTGEPEPYQGEPEHIDANGKPLKVGSRVTVGPEPGDQGTVVSISDLEGDVDDEGRSIAIMPRVYVRFDDGVEDDFGTSNVGGWNYYEPLVFQCDDLEVAA